MADNMVAHMVCSPVGSDGCISYANDMKVIMVAGLVPV